MTLRSGRREVTLSNVARSGVLCEYDDLFLYLPSILKVLKGEVVEGKAIGTAREEDIALLSQLGDLQSVDPERFSGARKRGRDVGKRHLKKVQAAFEDDVSRLIAAFRAKKRSPKEFAARVRNRARQAWRESFMAGLRAGGADGETKHSRTTVKLGPGDDKWLKSAMAHETRFLNKFIEAVLTGEYVMPLERRLEMYKRTLESFYDSGRVMALPGTAMLYWVGPRDKATCAGCEWMFRHSPFPKFVIPTTPRAGLTPCLSNCRDRLMVRNSTMQAVLKRRDELPSRDAMIRRLRKIKRDGR